MTRAAVFVMLAAVFGCREPLDLPQPEPENQQAGGFGGAPLPGASSLSQAELDALLQDAVGGSNALGDGDGSEVGAGPGQVVPDSPIINNGGIWQEPAFGASGGPWSADDRFGFDPVGRPTTPATLGPGCEAQIELEEVPCNNLDDDCDGMTDEELSLRMPCYGDQCRAPGVFACDTLTQSVVCLDPNLRDCDDRPQNVLRCGDGQLGSGEDCEYAGPHGGEGLWCRRDCRRTRLAHCISTTRYVQERSELAKWCEATFQPLACAGDEGVSVEAITELSCAEDGFICVEEVGACLPEVTEERPRCPEIPREPPRGCGNLAVSEEEECEPPAVNETDGTVCSWECKWVPASDNAEVAPPFSMLEMSLSEGGPVVCMVQCASDRDCPSSIPDCYMGTCVVPLEDP